MGMSSETSEVIHSIFFFGNAAVADADCLICNQHAKVREIIIHLNDEHLLTFEEIADWLDGLDIDMRFYE